ncbi:MAG: ParA family protein [Bdellovibrionales bacterium]|nr:ParA family protein [Bdellovibrionales bacterium]
MGQIISLVNQKGGVGKTTSSVNLASALALKKYKTLVIDADSQGNASRALNASKKHPFLYSVLLDSVPIQKAIQKTELENLFLIASNNNLAAFNIEGPKKKGWEFCLKENIQTLVTEFDFIFIDCPPCLGPLTVNVLTASQKFIVPLQCEYYALEGLSQLVETICRIRTHFNPQLQFQGILLTMFDSRNSLSHQIEVEVRKRFEDKVFQTIVPRNVRLSEAPSFGQTIFQYDPKSLGAKSYVALSTEFEKVAGLN